MPTFEVKLTRLDTRDRRYCPMCGRQDAATKTPRCPGCIDFSSLPRGAGLYDGDTGERAFVSDGEGTLMTVGCWHEHLAEEREEEAEEQGAGILWWIFVLGCMVVNGCLRVIR